MSFVQTQTEDGMSDQPIKNSDQPMDNRRNDTPPKTGDSMERFQSGDSEFFFEQLDEYDDVDDFAPVGKPSGGGAKGLSQKMSKRDDQKGGGSGGIYSAKHIRQKEALSASKKSAEKK
jgi:hypothetical protein